MKILKSINESLDRQLDEASKIDELFGFGKKSKSPKQSEVKPQKNDVEAEQSEQSEEPIVEYRVIFEVDDDIVGQLESIFEKIGASFNEVDKSDHFSTCYLNWDNSKITEPVVKTVNKLVNQFYNGKQLYYVLPDDGYKIADGLDINKMKALNSQTKKEVQSIGMSNASGRNANKSSEASNSKMSDIEKERARDQVRVQYAGGVNRYESFNEKVSDIVNEDIPELSKRELKRQYKHADKNLDTVNEYNSNVEKFNHRLSELIKNDAELNRLAELIDTNILKVADIVGRDWWNLTSRDYSTVSDYKAKWAKNRLHNTASEYANESWWVIEELVESDDVPQLIEEDSKQFDTFEEAKKYFKELKSNRKIRSFTLDTSKDAKEYVYYPSDESMIFSNDAGTSLIFSVVPDNVARSLMD